MRLNISSDAANYIRDKGGNLIIFQGSFTGCCIGKVPSPMIEIGVPKRPHENYDILNLDSGITVYLDKDLASYNGTGKITLSKNLWWKSLSFDYREDQNTTNGGTK